MAIVAGSHGGSGENTAEILDFTQEGSSWQESKLIFCSGIIFVVCTFHRQGNECNRVFPEHKLMLFYHEWPKARSDRMTSTCA